jgi:cytochrome c peroxidase
MFWRGDRHVPIRRSFNLPEVHWHVLWLIGLGLFSEAATGNDDNLGLPSCPSLFDNPQTIEKIALGRKLFADPRLSRGGTISCASCHVPEHAFSDGRRGAQGVGGQRGARNTPSLLNVVFNLTEFWDGRRVSLEAQALDPLTNPLEHGLKDDTELIDVIRSDSTYIAQFLAAFSVDAASITSDHVAKALASYERTLIAGDSPFDRFLYAHDKAALDAGAQRGLSLFLGIANCSNCHTIGRADALFTDHEYHSVNVGLQSIASKLPALTTRLVAARNEGARIDAAILSDPDMSELGRFAVTLDPADIGKFRTPSLRNVALTAPYMHDGSVATLEEAVDRELYDHVGEAGRPLILTPREKGDLVEFLKSLTSPVAARSYKAEVSSP